MERIVTRNARFQFWPPGGTRAVASPNFGTRRGESFQLLVTTMAALFTARLKIQKQEPGRENGGSDIEPAGVIPNNVRVLHRAWRTRSLGNQAQCAENEIDDDSSKNHRDVKNSGNPSRGARSVIFGVNDDDRNDDEVCINKRNYTPETD